MFNNYMKIAVRNLTKFKSYSFINIFGLAVGLTSCLLIMLYVKQELRYDEFHEQADRIYRIGVENTYSDRVTYYSQTPVPMAPAFRIDFPEINHLTRLYFDGPALLEANDKRIFESKIVFAEPEFFEIFSFHVIAGDAQRPLGDPAAIVLTKSSAQKYFGDHNPVGQIVRYENKYNLRISAVIEDVPVTSHFTFDFLVSYEALNEDILGMTLDQWGAFADTFTYLLLPENLTVAQLESQTADFFDRHSKPKPNLSRSVFFQPLTDIYLYSHNVDDIDATNSMLTLVILSLVAGFILLIACINFMNLSTARSTRRAKEVGIRKVLGAFRVQLTKQFLGESILIAAVAMAMALALIEVFLPYFSRLVGKEVDFIYNENIEVLLGVAGLTLLVGIVSGIYPALILSGFKPVSTIKGYNPADSPSRWPLYLRRGLVVVQFTISIVLIFGTLVVRQQLQYMQNTDMGFEKEHTMVLPLLEDGLREKTETLKNELMSHPNIIEASAGYRAPISDYNFDTSAFPKGYDGKERFSIEINVVDFDYFKNYGIPFLAGRDFKKEFSTDFKEAFIVNEALVKKLGFSRPEEALGYKLPIGINRIAGTIIGVVKDFHFRALRKEIRPMVNLHWPVIFRQISVTISGQNMPETIKFIEEVWQKHQPSYPFQYQFLNDQIQKLYETEVQALNIVTTFSTVAITIACLGLLGLSAFMAEQRTKEIGVRKVLGAGVNNIIMLLSRDFLKLVLVAGILAAPVAYFASTQLLQNFAYRIEPGVGTALLSIGLAFFVALFTVSFQAMKTAIMNPVEALRYE